MTTASAVLLWRAALIETVVGAANPPLNVSAVESERVSTTGHAPPVQELLRRVDHAASASGVRVASVSVRSAQDRPESPTQPRLELQFSGAGPYRASKSLVERLLQSDPSLVLDRVSFTRTADSSGDLDVQLNFHVTDLERQ